MRLYIISTMFVVMVVGLISCAPAKLPYEVIGKEQSNIPDDIMSSVQVLLGHRGHLLSLRGYFVFEPGEYSSNDTYLWVHTDGRAIELKSVTSKSGVMNVVINEIDKSTSELDRYLLIKFPGKQSKFTVDTTHSNYSNFPGLDLMVIKETRSGLPGTFVGLIDANSIEVQIDLDMAWPGNDKPTVFRLSDGVKAFFNTLKINDRVLLTFERSKNGDLIITEATKINDPGEQEEFSGLKATFNGLADSNSFEVTLDSGQAVVGTINIQMSDEVREAVDDIKTGDKVTLSLVRNQSGQWVATGVTKK
ncbi:MAG: hypothetical protein Q8S19_07115 [Bacillota bacterium]|nr:hypothetical protein [Bacillota bacterium]